MANEDPAAVIGADENSTVPVLTGEYANLSAQDTTRERRAAQLRANNLNNADPNAMDVSDDDADCSMIILDGVVMGPPLNPPGISVVHPPDRKSTRLNSSHI